MLLNDCAQPIWTLSNHHDHHDGQCIEVAKTLGYFRFMIEHEEIQYTLDLQFRMTGNVLGI